MPTKPRDGLAWNDTGLNNVPVWTRDPNLDGIVKTCREKLHTTDVSVSFFAQGAFNKLYLVQSGENNPSYIMRVSLPVHPQAKTRGEVTTLRFLRTHTDIPVPDVLAFDDSANNEIGFEWILMECMPGVSLYKKWRTLSAFQKARLVQRVAGFQSQLMRHPFSGIGTLLDTSEEVGQKPQPGELVSTSFFDGAHFDLDIPRGPFRSTHDWLASYLQIAISDHATDKKEAEDEEDEDDVADAEFALGVTRQLISLLPKIFPPLVNPPERSVIMHQDLSLCNILVNDRGEITAIVDWECVSAMPLWMATEMPKFLDLSTRDEEPRRDGYGDESDGENGGDGGDDDDALDNEGKNELYWIHLMEYETTQLRELYNTSMRQMNPGWGLLVDDSAFRQDFARAAFYCGYGFSLKKIAKWVDAVEQGEYPRLMDVLEG
ncbi:phosphotransferase family protein [Aspergillus mulundensis]|uniref:Aminoglycoside phosphotransferase n=1 Tax=Aspergillus mulundensis TaxID=1810919 RepID=A0A3D8QHK2_9EURO|nr:Aminoglycoside phosphotransferase [Aspergillus mulundensis]RDW61201.1 Aminoglycoside phosphotransferase [Aspergillus mulundensis]